MIRRPFAAIVASGKLRTFALNVALFGFGIANSVSGSIIFSDNFESYPVPSMLPGQGGWEPLANPAAHSNILINATGTGLPAKKVSGFENPGDAAEQSAIHPLPGGFQTDSTYTLTFDAMAVYGAGANKSHNASFGFSNNSVPQTVGFHWQCEAATNGSIDNNPRWVFSGLSASTYLGHFDSPVRFQIVLDPVLGEAFGRADWDFNGTYDIETPHQAMSLAVFQSQYGVEVYEDWRAPTSHVGAEFDNISVDAQVVPEPATLSLFGLGAIGLLMRRHRGTVAR